MAGGAGHDPEADVLVRARAGGGQRGRWPASTSDHRGAMTAQGANLDKVGPGHKDGDKGWEGGAQ